MEAEQIDLAGYIRQIPDWPKKGILFRDITPLLADSKAFAAAIKQLYKDFEDSTVDYIAAVEARGFIFGSAVAYSLFGGLDLPYSLYFSVISFTALGYGSWVNIRPEGWVQALGATESFIGVFMMALLLVTFVRKWTR